MGRSDKPSNIDHRFSDHARYLTAFLDEMVPDGKIVLVLHDWGSALGLDWARRHEERISGLALMEFITPLQSWNDFPEALRESFKAFRAPESGRKMLIDENAFIEMVLPFGVARKLSDEELNHYREPFQSPRSREPVYRWPNELPIAGDPADVSAITEKYYAWLLETRVPKLMFWATPGGLVSETKAVWYTNTLHNVRSVAIGPGIHYVQEDNPHLIGYEIAEWLPSL